MQDTLTCHLGSRYEGMLKILRFNWKRYALTLIGCAVALGIADHLSPWLGAAVVAGAIFAVLWSIFSLVVSHWVYDRSEIYRWNWIATWFCAPPKRWVHLHAGLDDSSECIRTLFPETEGTVVDIFDPAEMTEASIVEARKISRVSGEHADFKHLPLKDEAADAVFLIFTAHELRGADAREELFQEVFRVTGLGGRVVLLEHLRDWKNFAAFGPGFLHFYSHGEWLRLAKKAGFEIESDTSMTPFVRLFILRKET